MPPLIMGRDTPLRACLDRIEGFDDGYATAQGLREMYATDEEARRVIDVAKGLEGLRRQDGIHAAAVVITKEPLTEYLPVQRKPESGQNPAEAPIVTQYEMHGVEELGLLKMDFLGLRNLSVIERALDLVAKTEGERPDIDGIPLDDPATFAMLQRGDSIGVFQLEGGPMRSLMRSLAPTGFDDVAALVALYRPGPMAANMHRDYADRKNGRQAVSYLHPDLEPILGDTYGLMIYQESVMRVAQRFAGYTLEEADNLRKACGKKIRAMIQAEREKFVAGCVTQGYEQLLGTKLFDIIEPFADYAFNKSHSYGYGLVAYQTAWLKAHYPVEYFAALLTSVKDDKDKTAIYLGECRTLGIEVLVPDVNRSAGEFTPLVGEDGAHRIVFGLAAVRNVGESLVDRIVAEREANGPFTDFYDFCRASTRWCSTSGPWSRSSSRGPSIRSSIPARACASCSRRSSTAPSNDGGRSRRGSRRCSPHWRASAIPTGAPRPWGTATRVCPVPDAEFAKTQRLAFEKEMLGLYVSDHPLRGFEAAVARLTDCSIADLKDLDDGPGDGSGRDGQVRTVGGVVTGLVRRYTKRGELMATFVLEDLRASIEVFVFPKVMAEIGALLADDAVFVVRGRARHQRRPGEAGVHGGAPPPAGRRRGGGAPGPAPARGPHRPRGRPAQAAAFRAPRRRARLPPRGPIGPPAARPNSTWTAAGGSSVSSGCCSARVSSWPDRPWPTWVATCARGRARDAEWARGPRVPYPGRYPRADEDLGPAIARRQLTGCRSS